MVAHSSEFENIVIREEEQNELEMLARTSCPLEVKGGPSNKHGKISILIQVILQRSSGFVNLNFLISERVSLLVTNMCFSFPVVYISWFN